MDDWSAPVWALLEKPGRPAADALRLSVKQLVVDGAWTGALERRPRRWRGDAEVLVLRPTGRTPLHRVPGALLHARLLREAPEGADAVPLLKAVVKRHSSTAEDLQRDAASVLVGAGLLERRRRWYGERLVHTPAGTASAGELRARLRAASRATDRQGAVALLASAPLFLLLDRDVRRALGGGGEVGVWVGDGDLDAACDGALDSALDSAVDGSGADGGDGGGGD